MEANTAFQALTNSAEQLGLTVMVKNFEDKRKSRTMYFLQSGNQTVSPVLNFENMNHFLLGMHRAKNLFKL